MNGNSAHQQFVHPDTINQAGSHPWWQSPAALQAAHAALQAQQQHQRYHVLSASGTSPQPPRQLSLEALLSAPTLDDILNARNHTRPQRAGADVSLASTSLIEVPRALSGALSIPSSKPVSAPVSLALSQAIITNAITADSAQPDQDRKSPIPPSRRNPWDEDEEDGGVKRGSAREAGSWDKAAASAVAEVEKDQTKAGSAALVMSAGSVGPSMEQLQIELAQLQLMQRQQAHAVGLFHGQDILPSPPSPTSTVSSLASLHPQAPLYELQKANLKRSSSASSSRSSSMMMLASSSGHVLNQASTVNMRGQAYQQGGTPGLQYSTSATNGSLASQESLRRQGSRRGAYPEFPGATSNSQTRPSSDAQVVYGIHDNERTSNSSSISERHSAPTQGKAATGSSGNKTSSEPWGGVLLARGFAAVKSIKRREGMVSGSGTPPEPASFNRLSGSNSNHLVRATSSNSQSAIEPGSVTITGPTAVLKAAGGSTGALFPVYVRPEIAKASAGSAGSPPAGSSPVSPGRSSGSLVGSGDRRAPALETPGRPISMIPHALPIHREEAEEDEPSGNSDQYTSISHFTTASQFTTAASTVVAIPPSCTPPAGSSPQGPMAPISDGRGSGAGPQYQRQPSFGVAAGPGKFKVRPQLITSDNFAAGPSVFSSSSQSPPTLLPTSTSIAAVVENSSAADESAGKSGSEPVDARRSTSLTRSQQRVALGSHQIEITMTDFKASHV